MAHYKLYCIGASGNSFKVALYLNCAGLDWKPVGIDFAGGEQRDASWRAGVNAMGEVPVLRQAAVAIRRDPDVAGGDHRPFRARRRRTSRGAALDPVRQP
jgi:hypothetical protein